MPQKKCDSSFGICTDNNGRSCVEFFSKKSSDCSLQKHEVPENISDGVHNLISNGEVFFGGFL